jgi:hypothetical protein
MYCKEKSIVRYGSIRTQRTGGQCLQQGAANSRTQCTEIQGRAGYSVHKETDYIKIRYTAMILQYKRIYTFSQTLKVTWNIVWHSKIQYP